MLVFIHNPRFIPISSWNNTNQTQLEQLLILQRLTGDYVLVIDVHVINHGIIHWIYSYKIDMVFLSLE